MASGGIHATDVAVSSSCRLTNLTFSLVLSLRVFSTVVVVAFLCPAAASSFGVRSSADILAFAPWAIAALRSVSSPPPLVVAFVAGAACIVSATCSLTAAASSLAAAAAVSCLDISNLFAVARTALSLEKTFHIYVQETNVGRIGTLREGARNATGSKQLCPGNVFYLPLDEEAFL